MTLTRETQPLPYSKIKEYVRGLLGTEYTKIETLVYPIEPVETSGAGQQIFCPQLGIVRTVEGL